ncbi:MAG TPA: glycosyltransferase family 4 protein [Sphingobacterium bovisgrunnientis]|nr:glycosyltransferase family 4 protein [Sphingobacterium bovisgrunnientis]
MSHHLGGFVVIGFIQMITMLKKILIVCDASKTLLAFRGKLIEKMKEKHQVYVFTPEIGHDFIRKGLREMGVIVIENKLNASNISVISDLNYILSLNRVIKEIKPDVFFPFAFKPVIYGTFLAKLNQINLISPMLTGLGYNFAEGNNKKFVASITRLLLKTSLKKHPRLNIIFQNRDDADKLLDLKIISPNHNVHVVNGSGVDLSHYAYSEPQTDSITFLMIARLINAKGVNEYYEAAQIIKEKYPHIEFKLIGDYDKNIDSISKDLYQKIISENTINYLGHVNDVRTEIAQSSVVVLPSYYREGVPRSLLESMAMGRAVITCDTPGCKETINGKIGRENGFLIPPKDSRTLADKMEFFILNREKITDYGKEGLAFAKEKFDVNLVNKDMLRIMELEN